MMSLITTRDDNFPINLALPVKPEQLAEIIDVTYPMTPLNPNDPINIIVTIMNKGETDGTIFSQLIDEDTGTEIDIIKQNLLVGESADFSHSLTMPNRNLNLAIQAGHEALPKVIFRQSWLPQSNPTSTSWIAVDTDGNNVLEGWGSVASIGSTAPPEEKYGYYLISYDPTGRGVYLKSNKVYIYRGYTISHQYWEFDKPAVAETSSDPVEPYASNGQETWI